MKADAFSRDPDIGTWTCAKRKQHGPVVTRAKVWRIVTEDGLGYRDGRLWRIPPENDTRILAALGISISTAA